MPSYSTSLHPPSSPPRSDLLQQIKMGRQLKKVDPGSQEKAARPMSGFGGVIAGRLDAMREALASGESDYETDDSDWDSD